IDKMLQAGIIRESRSPWAARIVKVTKPDGSIRVCGNYIPLNEATEPDSFPIPDIPYIIDWAGQRRYKAKIDLHKGFWQIPLAEESKPCTAFYGPRGLYEYNVMPFGVRNGPAAFQRIVNHILQDYIGTTCQIYIDDILIGGDCPED